ncbi:MAG: LOG family protein [Pseudanabaenaceae cyanobacterium]|jgi:uncharacterized protein (TIGR00730 family)
MSQMPQIDDITALKNILTDLLSTDFQDVIHDAHHSNNFDLFFRSLAAIEKLQQIKTKRADWKLITSFLEDMAKAIEVFQPYEKIRKVSVFGSARLPADSPEYAAAQQFAQHMTAAGFMVITGAGGGIMAAANQGAGSDNSFGLNISLPFEQSANEFITDTDRLINFRYFFTRKLCFVKESDAIALFPGGFGTQDEFFECLTLCQTGRTTPRPLILIDSPDGNYWRQWDAYMQSQLRDNHLINSHDHSLYTVTNDIDLACQTIISFYQVYHSSRWVGDTLVLRLTQEITDAHLARLNEKFNDILIKGEITRSTALPKEVNEPDIYHLPRLIMHFDRHSFGRFQEFIFALNDTCDSGNPVLCKPAYR